MEVENTKLTIAVEKALKDVYQIVAKGVAQNMPIYEIAKNLEITVSSTGMSEKPLFFDTIKKAKMRVENYLEERLITPFNFEPIE